MRGLRCAAASLAMLTAGAANADGEYGPMLGGSLIAARGPDELQVAGVQGELSLWYGPLGLALEGSHQWATDGSESRVATAGASLRVLVFRTLVPSFLEPRDVELGFELHGIVERAWWDDALRAHAPVAYGGGLAVRLRGGSDDLSNLIAESRLFVRVVASRDDRPEISARGEAPGGGARELTVTFGLGASFGGGDRHYVQRFRPRLLDGFILP